MPHSFSPFTRQTLPALWVLTLLGTGLPLAAWAQQETEWRVINPISPTVVPLYANQPSPFTTLSTMQPITPTGPTPEELAHQQLLNATLSRARAQVFSAAALEPRLDGISCNGALQGPLGWSALCAGRWIKSGAQFEVATQEAAKTGDVLRALNELDPDTASQLRAELNAKIASTQLKITVQQITSQSIVLGGNGQSWRLPIRQSAD